MSGHTVGSRIEPVDMTSETTALVAIPLAPAPLHSALQENEQSAPQRMATQSTVVARATCGRCMSDNLKCLGSGSRRRTVGGAPFTLVRYSCRLCGHVWQQAPVRMANAFHPGQAAYVCDECGVGFKRQGALRRHIERKHNPTKGFSCVNCSAGFKSRENLRAHERFCTRDGSVLVCRCCGASFANREQWKVHRKETAHREFDREGGAVASAAGGEEAAVGGTAQPLAKAERIDEGQPVPVLHAIVLCAVAMPKRTRRRSSARKVSRRW